MGGYEIERALVQNRRPCTGLPANCYQPVYQFRGEAVSGRGRDEPDPSGPSGGRPLKEPMGSEQQQGDPTKGDGRAASGTQPVAFTGCGARTRASPSNSRKCHA